MDSRAEEGPGGREGHRDVELLTELTFLDVGLVSPRK